MNDGPSTTALDHIDGPARDELLSALIDGELAEAAAARGLSEAAVRSRVESDPQWRDRREQLETARHELAHPYEPLDDLQRHRLVGAAVPRGPELSAGPARRARRRERIGLVAGAAAAALLLVVGLTVVLGEEPSDDSASGDAAQATAAPDLGEVSDPQVLRDQVEDLDSASRAAAGTETEEEAAVEMSAPASGDAPSRTDEFADAPEETAPEPAAGGEDSGAADDAGYSDGARATRDCLSEVVSSFGPEATPTFTATATYAGRPAGVVGFDRDERLLVVVYALDDCGILASQSL